MLPASSVLRNPERRWSWLLSQIKQSGSSLAEIARGMELSRSAVQCAKYAAYPRVECVIAKRLGMRVQELFPDRYDADGVPIKAGIKPSAKNSKSFDKLVSVASRKGAKRAGSARA
jgi:Ner family transcriptional regulator